MPLFSFLKIKTNISILNNVETEEAYYCFKNVIEMLIVRSFRDETFQYCFRRRKNLWQHQWRMSQV